jgi:hypothetical protein
LGAIVHSLRTISADDLRASIATPRMATPSLLNGIKEANADVIIVLSEEAGFNPFTSPCQPSGKSWSQSQTFGNTRSRCRPRTQRGCSRTRACRWIGPQR